MIQPPDVPAYLESKGWRHRRSGRQYELDCPLCGKPRKFYISEAGLWDCKICLKAGNFFQLKQALGDAPRVSQVGPDRPQGSKPLCTATEWESKYSLSDAGKAFLASRALPQEAYKPFKLASNAFKGKDRVLLPYIRSGDVVFVKARGIQDKADMARFPTGAPNVLFGLHLLDTKLPVVILVEGEFDAIAGRAYGLPNVLSVPNGASHFDPCWLRDLEFAQVVVLGLDNDEKGSAGAKMMAEKLGLSRCKRVLWPQKDLNDCLKAGVTREEIHKLVGEAQDTLPDNLKTAERVYEEMLTSEEGPGRETSLKGLQKTLGGIRQAEVTVLVGDTGCGKSTFGINLVHDAMEHGQHCLIISSEMSAARVMSKLASMIAGQDYLRHGEETKALVREYLRAHPLFYLDIHGQIPADQMREAVTYCATTYGVSFVLMDHLHFFVQAEPDQERQALEAYMRAIVSMKLETQAHIVLISHPRATKTDHEKVGMASIKGASGIKQDADNVLSLNRKVGQDRLGMSWPVLVTVHKNRYKGELCGSFKIDFKAESQRYYDRDPGSDREEAEAEGTFQN